MNNRVITTIFGMLFLALGIAVAVLGDGWAYLVATVLAVLGAQAIVSAYRGGRAWLMWIGPLP